MKKIIKKTILTVMIVVLAVYAGILVKENNFEAVKKVFAGENENMRGQIWGGSEENGDDITPDPSDDIPTGANWISLNSKGCDDDNNGYLDGGVCGGDNATVTVVSYGVNIPPVDCTDSETCELSGYAWSSSLGWISFNKEDVIGDGGDDDGCGVHMSCISGFPCPLPAQRVGNEIKGWARIIAIKEEYEKGNSGTYYNVDPDPDLPDYKMDGCVSLSSLTGSGYGIQINADNSITGRAWSEQLGWLDLKNARIEAKKQVIACPRTINIVCSDPPCKSEEVLKMYYSEDSLYQDLSCDCFGKEMCQDVTNQSSFEVTSGNENVEIIDSGGDKNVSSIKDVEATPLESIITGTYDNLTSDIQVIVTCRPDCSSCANASDYYLSEEVPGCNDGCGGPCMGSKIEGIMYEIR